MPAASSSQAAPVIGHLVDLAGESGLDRQTDYEFLTSREARELLQQEGIVVIDYSTIQQVWSPASALR
jgi:hypothetical protein